MKIKTVTTHTVSFSVKSFEQTEGGMIHNRYGSDCADIGAAIELLRIAQIHSGDDWIIVCDVATDIGTSEI